MTFEFSRVRDARSNHDFPIYAQEEHCRCGNQAAHKIEETSGPWGIHPFTAYVCCKCFTEFIGWCGGASYDF